MKPKNCIKRWLAGPASISQLVSHSTTVMVTGLVVFSMNSARAADIQWSGAAASYTTTGNWAGGVVPGPNDNAIVTNNGTVQINPADPTWFVGDLRASSGGIVQSGSRARLNAWLRLGQNAGSTGTFDMSSGRLDVPSGEMHVGEVGTGVFNFSGGEIYQRNGLVTVGNRTFGPNTTAQGFFNQTGGSFSAASEVWIGYGGAASDLSGTFEMSDGSLNLSNWTTIGRTGGHGKFHLSGGTLNKSTQNGNAIQIGSHDGAVNGIGEFIQDGGNVKSGGELWIGQGSNVVDNNVVGSYDLNSGTLDISNWIAIGRERAKGTLNINGGSIRKVGNGSFTMTGDSTVNQTGGIMDIQSGRLIIGEYAVSNAVYNLGGTGVVQVPEIVLVQNNDANIFGTLNLNSGGTLRTGRLYKQGTNATSTATANFDGGKLVAIAHEANFISGLNSANLLSGGLHIDSNGFKVSSPQMINGGGGNLFKEGRGTFNLGSASFISEVYVDAGIFGANGTVSTGTLYLADGAGLAGTGTVDGIANLGTTAGSYLLADSNAANKLKFTTSIITTANTRIDFSNHDVTPSTPILVATFDNNSFLDDFSIGGFTLGRPGTIDTLTTYGEIWVTVDPARTATWTGAQDSTWDIFSTANWNNSGDNLFGQGDSVSFGNPAGPSTITISGPVRPAAILVNNTNPITFDGTAADDIAGSVVITKSGTGKLTVALDTTLNADQATPTVIPSTVTVNAGELQLGNGGTTGSLGQATITNNSLLSFNYSGDKTIGNTINGTGGSISKSGAGTLTLTANAAFTGTTTINGGRLRFRSPAVPGTGAITNNGEFEFVNNGALYNLNAPISGSGKLLTSGTGEIWLNTANTFSGDVEVGIGNTTGNTVTNALNITHAQALGTTAGKTIVNGFNGTGGQFVNIRALTAGGTTLAEPFVLNSSPFGRAGFRHEGGTQTLTLTGPITVNSTGMSAVQIWNSNATSTLNIQGDITSPAMYGASLLLRGSSGPINVTGNIMIADQAELAITDGASVRLGAVGKTYQGFRTTVAVGQLRTLLNNTLPVDQPVHLGEGGNASKWLLGEGATGVTQTISGLTSTTNAAASGIVSGASTMSTLTVNQGFNSNFDLPIGGALANENLIALVKTGKGTLGLNKNNTYTGTTTVSAGTLLINAETKASAFTVAAGATVGGVGKTGTLLVSGSPGNTANIAPGNNGIGTLTLNSTGNLGPDSAINWQVQDWTGAADKILGSSTVNVTATNTNKVVIRISQLGNITNFSEADKSFEIVKASFGITNFADDKFVLDATGFTAGTGTWALRKSGVSLLLDYTAGLTGNYVTWANTHGIPGEPATGDFDKDGLTNLMEYGLGLNPTVPNGSPGTYAGGLISFAKGTDAVTNGDVTWTIETSTTLGAAPSPWTPVTPTTNNPTTIAYMLPTGMPKTFARLVVTKNP